MLTIGVLLLASGVVHAALIVGTGANWHGPVTLRKAATFGLSMGLTLITLAWLSGWLTTRPRPRSRLLGLIGSAAVVEVVRITMQAWRGVTSHFNASTTFDRTVFLTMGAGIVVLGGAVLAFATIAFRRPLSAPASLQSAARSGLALMVASQLIGVVMLAAGLAQMSGDGAYDAGGPLRLPHAVTLHGIQLLPGLAWLLSFADGSERRRVRLTILATAGYGLLSAASLGHAWQPTAAAAVAAAGASGYVLTGATTVTLLTTTGQTGCR